MNYFKWLSVFFFLFVLFGCKEDDRTIQISELTNHDWHLQYMKFDIHFKLPVKNGLDSVVFPDDCDTSDYTRFFNDSTYIKYNISKCDPEEGDLVKGNWTYNKNGSIVNLSDEDDNKEEFVIFELTDRKMILIQEAETSVSGDKRIKVIWRKTYYYAGTRQ